MPCGCGKKTSVKLADRRAAREARIASAAQTVKDNPGPRVWPEQKEKTSG